MHMKLMHPKIDEFNCNICDKKFKRKWNLRSHLNFVHGVQENKGNFFFLNSQENDDYLIRKFEVFHWIQEQIPNFVFRFL